MLGRAILLRPEATMAPLRHDWSLLAFAVRGHKSRVLFFFFCSYFEAVFRMTFSSCSRPLDAINLRFCSLFTSSRWSGPTPAALNASPLPAATRRSASFPFIPMTDEGGRFFVSVLSGEKAEGKKW